MIDDFQIEPDVPMPEGRARPMRYPFDRMQIGESFAFDKKFLTNVRNNAGAYSKRHGGKFACRQVGTDIWRCWRVE